MSGPKKDVEFRGDSLKRLRDFPEDAKQEAGFQLDAVQEGEMPEDFKPMPEVGQGVYEIRIKDSGDEFRVFYIANVGDLVYVLHCFQKKTKKTSKKDIDIGKKRYKELPH